MARAEPGAKCKFFISIEQPECGEKAVANITTRITRKDQARVPLCLVHKRQYDNQMAQLRTTSKKEV